MWKSRRGDYIKATATIEIWENTLNATFYSFRHRFDNRNVIYRAASYSIPELLKQHVSTIFHVDQFPPKINGRMYPGKPFKTMEANVLNKSNLTIYPHTISASSQASNIQFLRNFYEVPAGMLGNPNVTQSVFETSGSYFSLSDWNKFQNAYGIPGRSPISIGNHSSDAACVDNINNCGEGNLDVQYMSGLAPYATMTYWYVDNSTDPFLQWITDVADTPHPPMVNSISYGMVEQVRTTCAVIASVYGVMV